MGPLERLFGGEPTGESYTVAGHTWMRLYAGTALDLLGAAT
jgi:hypothetical protein